jgi:hypothetical protein
VLNGHVSIEILSSGVCLVPKVVELDKKVVMTRHLWNLALRFVINTATKHIRAFQQFQNYLVESRLPTQHARMTALGLLLPFA